MNVNQSPFMSLVADARQTWTYHMDHALTALECALKVCLDPQIGDDHGLVPCRPVFVGEQRLQPGLLAADGAPNIVPFFQENVYHGRADVSVGARDQYQTAGGQSACWSAHCHDYLSGRSKGVPAIELHVHATLYVRRKRVLSGRVFSWSDQVTAQQDLLGRVLGFLQMPRWTTKGPH